MDNAWLAVNRKYLDQIIKYLTECEYKPEFDNMPILLIQRIIKGAAIEIAKLQSEKNNLENEVKKLKESCIIKLSDIDNE